MSVERANFKTNAVRHRYVKSVYSLNSPHCTFLSRQTDIGPLSFVFVVFWGGFVVVLLWGHWVAAEEGDREGPVGMLYMTHDFSPKLLGG